MFEAKIANGNGEQTLSRDIYRLGHRFDFFRMLSCYYTTVGFYFSTMVCSERCLFTVYVKYSLYFLTHYGSYFTVDCAHSLFISVRAPLSCAKWTRKGIEYSTSY